MYQVKDNVIDYSATLDDFFGEWGVTSLLSIRRHKLDNKLA